MSGVEASKILRERYGNKVKIYLISGNVSVVCRRDMELFDGILAKPCTRLELQRVFQQLNDPNT